MHKLYESKNGDLLLPYFLPYGVFVIIASLPDGLLTQEWRFSIQILLTTILLAWYWKRFVPFKGPKSPFVSMIVGVIAGVLGAILWALLLKPFVDPAGKPYSNCAFVLRMAAAGLLVPIFEELLTRGFLLRAGVQWDNLRKQGVDDPLDTTLNACSIAEVQPGQITTLAVIISTVGFAAGHTMAEWPAAIAYGLLMVALWVIRKDLLSCIIAHGTTNIALGIFAKATGQWGLW
ncbi:MAG: CPBP family intramembrane metalloprotease [Planctomycetes bacterium]|nr:CPBP family intramembrane metalloprotease [Planctomycetota bacterium]